MVFSLGGVADVIVYDEHDEMTPEDMEVLMERKNWPFKRVIKVKYTEQTFYAVFMRGVFIQWTRFTNEQYWENHELEVDRERGK